MMVSMFFFSWKCGHIVLIPIVSKEKQRFEMKLELASKEVSMEKSKEFDFKYNERYTKNLLQFATI